MACSPKMLHAHYAVSVSAYIRPSCDIQGTPPGDYGNYDSYGNPGHGQPRRCACPHAWQNHAFCHRRHGGTVGLGLGASLHQQPAQRDESQSRQPLASSCSAGPPCRRITQPRAQQGCTPSSTCDDDAHQSQGAMMNGKVMAAQAGRNAEPTPWTASPGCCLNKLPI